MSHKPQASNNAQLSVFMD